MPSFKERFRSSRKSKKIKETGANDPSESISASGTSTNLTNLSIAGVSTATDEHTGSAALSTYSSHYSVDHCKSYIYTYIY